MPPARQFAAFDEDPLRLAAPAAVEVQVQDPQGPLRPAGQAVTARPWKAAISLATIRCAASGISG